jgi:N-acetylneuraminic acid mutarotase
MTGVKLNDNEVGFWGGCNRDGSDCTAIMHVFDTATNEFSVLQTRGTLPPVGKNMAAAVVESTTVRRLVTFGGYLDGEETDHFWALNLNKYADVEAYTWVQPGQSGQKPLARQSHCIAGTESKVYVFGGEGGDLQRFNDLHSYDFDDGIWREEITSGTAPSKRAKASMVMIGSRLVVFGGSDGMKALSDIWMYDTVASTWSDVIKEGLLKGTPPSPRQSAAAAPILHKMFMFGGCRLEDGRRICTNDAYTFDADTLTFEMRTNQGDVPTERRGMAMVAYDGNRVFACGGCHPESGCDNTLYMVESQFAPPRFNRS